MTRLTKARVLLHRLMAEATGGGMGLRDEARAWPALFYAAGFVRPDVIGWEAALRRGFCGGVRQ